MKLKVTFEFATAPRWTHPCDICALKGVCSEYPYKEIVCGGGEQYLKIARVKSKKEKRYETESKS